MLARSGATVGSAEVGETMPSLVSADDDAESVLQRIRKLITDDFRAAQELSRVAARRFPEHDGIANARRVLNDGKATVGTGGPQPSREADFEWLRNAPESVRGKWVALVGGKMIGASETLAELAQSLEDRTFPCTPLVHRLD